MGNFVKQQEERKEAKEKEKLSRETLGKFFYDLAKIVFTALVVGSIISVVAEEQQRGYYVLMAIGLFSTCIFSVIGYRIIKS